MAEVVHKIVPKYAEFKVEEIYKQCAEDPELMTYLPDLTMSKKLPDREFVYDVINSLRPKFLKEIVNHADEVRQQKKMFRAKGGEVTITQEWLNKLTSLPYISSKSTCKYQTYVVQSEKAGSQSW